MKPEAPVTSTRAPAKAGPDSLSDSMPESDAMDSRSDRDMQQRGRAKAHRERHDSLPLVMRASSLPGRVERALSRWQRRLRRIDRRVVTLRPEGESAGRALLSYIVDGFLLPEGVDLPRSHTHFWESREIGRILVELGFVVDAIHWTNTAFLPQSRYDLLVDVRLNLERLAPLLGPDCLRVMHAETSHRSFHNPEQQRRLDELAARRGVRIAPQKMLEENRAIESADAAIVVGNAATLATYAFAGKPMWPVPISQPVLYPFPEDKDYAACARRFLWFGSGGLVHKGLDLVLELFASLPDYHLTVCGPVDRERDFERLYHRELYETPNIRTVGWIDIGSPEFLSLARETLALVYPSCSEGMNGGTVTCMHAGLIPIVSRPTGVDLEPSEGVLLPDCRLETLRQAVVELAARPPHELAALARGAWETARRRNTREGFHLAWSTAMREILARFRPGLALSAPPA